MPAPPGPVPPAALAPAQRPPGTGFVECGPTRCDTRASACVRLAGKPAKCVSKAERDGYARGGGMDDAVLDCDDDADCPSNQHCCAGQYWGGTGPHIHMCSQDRCDDAIACIPATGCPPNLKCAPVGSSADTHCAPANAGTTCGKARCSGATPVCCWNSATNQGKCVAEPGQTAACTGDDDNRIRCRGRADCGGYDCCHYLARSTDCASTCPGASIGVACLTMADCPAEGPGPAGVRQRYERCEDGACTGKLCNPQGQWIPCDSM